VIGTLLGGPALGIYSMADSLARLPVEKIGALLSQVTPAFMATHQGDRDALKRLTLTLTEALASVKSRLHRARMALREMLTVTYAAAAP
jgi:PST family polysaccharide transporter